MTLPSGINQEELDQVVDPRDDLFRHLNGHWLTHTEIPADRARYGSFAVLAEEAEKAVHLILESSVAASPKSQDRKLGDLYASFMDASRIDLLGHRPLDDLISEVGAVTSIEDLLAVAGRLDRAGIGGALALFVDTDPGDPNRYVVFAEQGGISLPDERYYREPHFASLVEALEEHIAAMLELAGVSDSKQRSKSIVALERKVAAFHWDNVACRDSVKTYNLTDFDGFVGYFGGKSELLSAWREGLGVGAGVLDEVVVRQPSFVTGLASLFQEEHLGAWRDWLTWRIVHSAAPYLSESFVEENFAFYGKKLTGVSELRARWKRGVSFVEGAMGEAIGEIYVRDHFDAYAKERMDVLVGNLLTAYRDSILSLDWMGEETRKRALEKLEKFRPKIGYPDRWRDYSKLESDATDLWGNVRRVSEFIFQRETAKVGSPVDRDEWFMTPQTINAYYNPGFNEIVFPAAILQSPFFDAGRDDAANYGGIGAVIGHEIGHGFDDEGSKYDGDGRLRDWWTPADRSAFEALTKALIGQYDALVPLQLSSGHHVNGSLTIGENIGDLGGLAIAWKAYLLSLQGAEPPIIDGFTGGERFFFSWALCWREKRRDEEMERLLAVDPHSPSEFRCNQVARNIDAFHDTFGTTTSNKMWLDPKERVRIW